ncbi:MAG: rhamnogalacturonan lyase [Prevotella sp.]|nr:rhamnogalacturonan lyase [Prevotella sp.]
MKRLALLLFSLVTILSAMAQSSWENLNRGLVAIKNGNKTFVSWRVLATDAPDVTFDLLRNGAVVKSGLTVSNAELSTYVTGARYQVVARLQGEEQDRSEEVTAWDNIYTTLKLDRPASQPGYHYFPNDCSVADLDGDGEYEIVVKWDPSNNQDNSKSGKTGNVYLDAYKLDGTRLWRIDLGQNIRAGAHYTQFLVYDFNGDGRAELVCKTSLGSMDGEGIYVNQATDDTNISSRSNTLRLANDNGYILSGPEFLTVFEGTTGRALHTIWYNPNRGGTFDKVAAPSASELKTLWGDNYGNRCDRFLACVAHLDGADKPASAVMCRGYYTRSYLWAVNFDGSKLSTRWIHGSVSKTQVERTDAEGNKQTRTYSTNTSGIGNSYTAYGQGCHSVSVGDVDGDGCDEIIYGSAAIDHDGWLLHTTGLGHGDALHLTDLMPDREGLEVMMVHEETPYGWSVRDARTGELIIHHTGISDTGRGIAADIYAEHRGFEFWHSDDMDLATQYDKKGPMNIYSCNDEVVGHYTQNYPFYNFRIYWTGDLQDELFDKGALNDGQWQRLLSCGNYGNSVTYGSKANPLLIADFLGDWREEIIMFDKADSCTLNIFSTVKPTEHRIHTLMHDHIYRMSVAWQNVGYNQPPHLGFFLPDYKRLEEEKTGIRATTTGSEAGHAQNFDLYGRHIGADKAKGLYIVKEGSNVVKKLIR